MKHIFFILVFVVAAALAFVSCEDDSTPTVVSLTVQSSSVVVPYTGGEVSVGYKVSFARDGGYVLASTEEDWISDFDYSADDTLVFYVAEHNERVSRYGEVKLYYMVEADTLVTRSFGVSQEYNSNYNFTASYYSGQYLGMSNYYNSSGVRQYSLYLSDMPIEEYGSYVEGATYYFLDLWSSSSVEGTGEVQLPEGTYYFGPIGDNRILSGDSQYFVMNEDPEGEWDAYSEQIAIADGTVTVTRSDEGTSIIGSLEDYLGGTHSISYTGDLYLENEGLMTTLDGDEAVGDISDVAACEARYYGDYYQNGTSNWVFCIKPEVGTGFIIDVCAAASYDLDAGAPVGSFIASSTTGLSGAFLSGVVFNGYLSGTWLVSFDEEGTLTPPYAPICYGNIRISSSGDTYTVTVNGYDDLEYSVTGSWTGVPTVVDYRTSAASSSVNRLGILKLR